MKVTNAALAAKLDAVADDVAALKHVLLEGNGRPPLTERVASLETAQRLSRGERWMLRGGTAGALVAVVHALSHALS